MINLIYYTHASSKVCALYHDKELAKMAMQSYYNLLLMAHKKLDGVASIDYLTSCGFDFDSIFITDSPSLYWTTCSSYHYNWLFECFVNLVVQYEKHVAKTPHSCYVSHFFKSPNNILKKGFKAPYPLNPMTKNSTIESNVAVLNEVYKSIYVKPPEWPWLPGKPDWYKGE